ncbi:MAG: alpha/beta fold hydrolase [Brevinematales bacterium]|nr:alpha/beta fold hydrolase [Brevinematales bacterium]
MKCCFFIPGWGFSETIYQKLWIQGWLWHFAKVWKCTSPDTLEKKVIQDFISSKARVVCGYSLGSMLALELAFRFPFISDVILISPTARFCREDGGGFSQRVIKRMLVKLSLFPSTVLQDFVWQCVAPHEKDIAHALLSTPQKNLLPFQTPFLRSGLEALMQWDKRSLLPKISSHVWILRGTADTLCTEYMAKEITKTIPCSREKTYDRAGHLPFLSCPDFLQDWKDLFQRIGNAYDK